MQPETKSVPASRDGSAERLQDRVSSWLTARTKLQRAVAGLAAVFFFGIFIWVMHETYRNVILPLCSNTGSLESSIENPTSGLKRQLEEVGAKLKSLEAFVEGQRATLANKEQRLVELLATVTVREMEYQKSKLKIAGFGYEIGSNGELIELEGKWEAVKRAAGKAGGWVKDYTDSLAALSGARDLRDSAARKMENLRKKINQAENSMRELTTTQADLRARISIGLPSQPAPAHLHWLVCILHFVTGIYAFVLGVRSVLRWMQLNGTCSASSLVEL